VTMFAVVVKRLGDVVFVLRCGKAVEMDWMQLRRQMHVEVMAGLVGQV